MKCVGRLTDQYGQVKMDKMRIFWRMSMTDTHPYKKTM